MKQSPFACDYRPRGFATPEIKHHVPCAFSGKECELVWILEESKKKIKSYNLEQSLISLPIQPFFPHLHHLSSLSLFSFWVLFGFWAIWFSLSVLIPFGGPLLGLQFSFFFWLFLNITTSERPKLGYNSFFSFSGSLFKMVKTLSSGFDLFWRFFPHSTLTSSGFVWIWINLDSL